ncbi:MAG: hypothetical protein WBD40_12405 [Tepidisphaeraceae bacterium]
MSNVVELNGFAIELSLRAWRHGQWIELPLTRTNRGLVGESAGFRAELTLDASATDRLRYHLGFAAPFRSRLRLRGGLPGARNPFHLIPGNIFGDNNAPHVRAGEFPCLAGERSAEKNRAPLWEFRADRASHPVSMLCCADGAVAISIDPYSPSDEADDGFIRNGVFAALPDAFGVSLGYGNDPLTFVEKTHFVPATSDLSHGAEARGSIFAQRGNGRQAAHRIIRALYEQSRELPTYQRSYDEALRALADSFATVNWSPELQQYTNRKCRVPIDTKLEPWRAVVEIGWTGGSMMAYPFALAERLFPHLRMPRTSAQIFDEICSGWNESSGLLNDTCINRATGNRPTGWNDSEINGWWSGFLPQTKDNHCAYTNAHAAYYLLKAAGSAKPQAAERWTKTALQILDTAVALQRDDGAFGYIFSSRERKVIDFDGFAGCWFAAALVRAWKASGETRYLDAAERAMTFYTPFVRDLTCWGSPMDTFKSIDSEGNLAFIRAARLLHEATGHEQYLHMLEAGAHYEYLWRYGFRTRPEARPLKGSNWNSCGGTITSVSNPHIHPMGVVATEDLIYLSEKAGDAYHRNRADDGMAWLMNTMELYPDITGYGRYGVLSERTCPSDGLLVERYADTGEPASTWWSYNGWAAASAMEAIGERLLATTMATGRGDAR